MSSALNPTPHRRARDRGSFLVVVLGVLTLLAVFSVSFAVLMTLERDAASNYQEQVRARLLARAGLERAFAELRAYATEPVDPASPPPWVFGEPRGTPLLSALCQRPSFSNGQVHPGRTPEEVRGYSSLLGGTFAQEGDLYALKVIDTASMIHVNEPNPDLPRVLRNLCASLGIADADGIATAIVRERPIHGFGSKRQLADTVRDAVTGGSPDGPWTLLADHLTCYAYAPPGSDRALLHVNTAPEAVLTAVLAGASGTVVIDGRRESVEIDFAGARRFVRESLLPRRNRSGFANWNDVRSWLAGVGVLTDAERAFVAAVFAPESKDGTAETPRAPLCYSPCGFFEVQAAGVIFDSTDRIVAEDTLSMVVRIGVSDRVEPLDRP